MNNKILKVLLIIIFSANLPCFSQTPENDSYESKLVENYNIFLKTIKLNKLVKATDFSFRQVLVQKNKTGKVHQVNLKVLTLEPAFSYKNHPGFAGIWSAAVKNLDAATKTNLYKVMFEKLTDFTKSSMDSLVIQLQMNDSTTISSMAHLKGHTKIIGPLSGTDGTNTMFNVDPSHIEDSSEGGMVPDVPYSKDLNVKTCNLLCDFFKPVMVKPEQMGPEVIYCSANYRHGPVTKLYRENITLNVIIQPSKIQGYMNLYYTFQVKYAGGLISGEVNANNYKNALDKDKYYKPMSDFGRSIKEQLKSLRK